jgi:preprotein translocase subunit SecG
MLFTIFSVFYVLIAAAMIVLILMQRGDGANAGASFGSGASGTVFGARGAASFLTRTTAVLAGLFFLLSLGMGIYLSHHGVVPSPKQTLGVMAGAGSSAPATSASAGAPAASAPVQHSEVPAAPAANPEVPVAPAKSGTPAAPAPKASTQAPVSSGGGH